MEKMVLSLRVHEHYVKAFDQLPGSNRPEKFTQLLNFALSNGYGSEALTNKESGALAEQLDLIETKMETYHQAINLLFKEVFKKDSVSTQ